MMTRTAAWDLIRSADPMDGVDVSGAFRAPAAQDLLRRITADRAGVGLASSGDADLTVLACGSDQVDEPRRGRWAPGLVAAVVVVLAVAAGATAWRHHRTAGSPYSQKTATGYSTALLAELPLPPGARRTDEAPIPEVAQSPFTGNGIIDARVAWWTITGSFAAAVNSFGRAALPAHWKHSAGSTTSGGSGPDGWVIEVRDPRALFVSSVTVVIAAHGRTVGMVAQVDTYPIPVRTPAQVIDPAVDSATFTFTGGGGRGYSSKLAITMTGPAVSTLARQVNATPAYVQLTTASCPASSGSVTVTFRSGRQRWSLNVNNGSFLCNSPSLTATSGAAIDLTPSTALLTEVLAAAGLPSDYLER